MKKEGKREREEGNRGSAFPSDTCGPQDGDFLNRSKHLATHNGQHSGAPQFSTCQKSSVSRIT